MGIRWKKDGVHAELALMQEAQEGTGIMLNVDTALQGRFRMDESAGNY